MAHFGEVSHTASDTLANCGIHNNLGEILASPVQTTNAKQRRSSRPNTQDEIRKKKQNRRKQRRNERKMSTKKQKRLNLVAHISKQVHKVQETKLCQSEFRAEEMRKKAVSYCKKWKAERMKNLSMAMHQIDPENIRDTESGELGEGVFGKCFRKMYRGQIVAVKMFKSHAKVCDVEHEAKMIMAFDHPGLPFVFGVNTIRKPYFIVLEFYGISGKCITLADASKRKLFSSLPVWAKILQQCSSALAYIHGKKYIHCDIKGDNIVIKHDVNEEHYTAVIIDFGKMKAMSEAKLYKLSLKEQERYGKYHYHIAPEVVRGKQTQSAASDIYSLGQVISLVCHYNLYEELKKIAQQCIHGTPSKRPKLNDIISHLSLLY